MPEPEKKPETGKKAKDRSPNFPSINLKEAAERVKLLYDADKMAGSSRESTFKHLGYSGANGASLGILAALKKFDLIKEENSRIFVSENARTILLLPITDERRKKALKICALSPKIYNEIWEKFKESGLPSDETLKTDLIFEKGFSDKSALKFISDFKQTLSFAGIEAGEIEPVNELEGQEENTNDRKNQILNVLNRATVNSSTLLSKIRLNKTVKEYSIPYTNNRTAVLALEAPVSKKDIDFISRWLELLKETIEESSTIPLYKHEEYEENLDTTLHDNLDEDLLDKGK